MRSWIAAALFGLTVPSGGLGAETPGSWSALLAAFRPACQDYTEVVCRCGLARAARLVGQARLAREIGQYGDEFLDRAPLRSVALTALRNCTNYFRALPYNLREPDIE